MENILTSLFEGTPLDACSAEDKMLLGKYAAQLVADETPSRQRSMMLSSATQFMLWWRTLYTGDDSELCLSVVSGPDDASQRLHLREAYLCFACPDRELRQEERPFLNHFLRFMEQNPPSMAAASTEQPDSAPGGVKCFDAENRMLAA
jgi:hypothetical protein